MNNGGRVSLRLSRNISLGDFRSVYSLLLLLSSEDALVEVGNKENPSFASSSDFGVAFINTCLRA
jgi:hypothetical protein